MGLWDKIMGEFIDVIEWTDDSNDTLVYRFERYGNEIKYGAKLTVRASQVAVFVNEGQIADVLEPGLYELETKNIPVLSTLQHWNHGFSSPFKAEVYFCNTRQFVDLKWGTRNPLMLRDPEFGAVRLRAFGSYAIRIKNAKTFVQEIVGTDGHFTVDEISNQLRNLIVSRFSNIIGKAKIPVLDLAGNYDQIGNFISERIANEFNEYGLEITKVLIENMSLPPAVEEALDKRTSMGVIGNLDQYLKYQSAEAIETSAQSGGAASEAMNMGMGFAMAEQMAKSMRSDSESQSTNPKPVTTSASAPPPLPNAVHYHLAIKGQSAGPFPMDVLHSMVTQGTLNAKTLVWTEGMSGWEAASQIAALAVLFARSTPPPLPPQ